jgi:hypothetical protein
LKTDSFSQLAIVLETDWVKEASPTTPVLDACPPALTERCTIITQIDQSVNTKTFKTSILSKIRRRWPPSRTAVSFDYLVDLTICCVFLVASCAIKRLNRPQDTVGEILRGAKRRPSGRGDDNASGMGTTISD